jgi:hypothetical protein
MSTQTEQQSTPFAKPGEEHRWLEQLVGNWTYQGEAADQEGKATGTETVRSLGGLWFVAEGLGDMGDGAQAQTMMTLGYNPESGRYLGTWVGSMMTHLWVYDGELDAAKRVLTLNCEGPSMSGDGTMVPYRDVIEVIDSDHRTLKAYVKENGDWRHFMTTHYYRAE